jgi:hypothetical protein
MTEIVKAISCVVLLVVVVVDNIIVMNSVVKGG